MIGEDFHDFFLASAGAAAALIGLLFVAISVAPERVVGPKAALMHQIRASAALSALVSTLILSLVALIPDANIGYATTVIAAGAVLFVAATLRRLSSAHDPDVPRVRSLTLLLGFLIVMVLEGVAGIVLLVHPHSGGAASTTAGGTIALLAIGIDRSWELVGGRHRGMASSLSELVVGHDLSTPRVDGPPD